MSKWTNDDGLHVRFGLSTTEEAKVMQTRNAGPVQWLQAVVKVGENISTTSATQLAGGRLDAENPGLIPAGSLILRVFFIVDTAFDSGGSATLDLGLSIAAGTYAGGDEDGFDVAIAEADIDTAGKVIRCDGAYTTATAVTGVDLYPSFDVDSAAFTVGQGRLLVEYLPPMVN